MSVIINRSYTVCLTPYTNQKNISQNEHEHIRQIKPEQHNIATKKRKTERKKEKKEKATKPYALYTEQEKGTKARKGEFPSAVIVNVISSSLMLVEACQGMEQWMDGWMS